MIGNWVEKGEFISLQLSWGLNFLVWEKNFGRQTITTINKKIKKLPPKVEKNCYGRSAIERVAKKDGKEEKKGKNFNEVRKKKRY
ncbi:MAG: hypothetical protein CM15mP81_19520 [Alphaproteobacteria bacterium]|nr:MAG: hypothetical protein CM15mP81_19520 [Alphaproteobacteria bacterium]